MIQIMFQIPILPIDIFIAASVFPSFHLLFLLMDPDSPSECGYGSLVLGFLISVAEQVDLCVVFKKFRLQLRPFTPHLKKSTIS
jgi:hypothetical protein